MTKSLISVDAAQIAQWVEQFNRDGFLFIQNVIPPDLCAELRADLDRMLMDDSGSSVGKSPQMEIVLRAFEHSPANVKLFDLEPIVSLAEALISPDCHVIHNNSFKTPPGGGLSTWHQDDAAHLRRGRDAGRCRLHCPGPLSTSPTGSGRH